MPPDFPISFTRFFTCSSSPESNRVPLGDAAWRPNRDRTVSPALQAYAAMTTSAARGAVRDVNALRRR